MERTELEKKKKEDLILIILGMQKDIKEKDNTIYVLEKQVVKSKFEEYMYSKYLDIIKQLEEERQYNRLNIEKINGLEELLDRYKNIVDKLGGKTEYC